MPVRSRTLLVATLIALSGCRDNAGPPRPTSGPAAVVPPTKGDDHGHAHARGKMLIVDAGKYHALLTAHLSPKGNELDIFIETSSDANPTPVAVPVESFKAFAKKTGDDPPAELTFACAPADERPAGETPGTCSHFVAKAPWMKADDVLELTVPQLRIGDGVYRVVWKDFNPRKYAHHVE